MGREWQNGSQMRNLKRFLQIKTWSLAILTLGLAAACREKTQETSSLQPLAEGKSIVFGLQPSDNVKNLDLFQGELSRKIARKVDIKVAKDYSELVQLLKEGKIDFAFFSPLNLIEAEKNSDIKVLLKKVYFESEFYFSAIVVRSDSLIRNVKGLKGKKMAFVDPKSTSGYLYPQVLLHTAGLNLSDVKSSFSGTHKISMEMLEKKDVDAVAVWSDEPEKGTGAWTEESVGPNAKKRFRILAYSDAIPNDAFVARGEFYAAEPSLTLRVMEKMIELGEGEDSVLKQVFGVARLATATSRHYDSVRKMSDVLSSNGQ